MFHFDFIAELERNSLASVMGLREEPNSEGHGCERINSQHTIRKWKGYYEKRIGL